MIRDNCDSIMNTFLLCFFYFFLFNNHCAQVLQQNANNTMSNIREVNIAVKQLWRHFKNPNAANMSLPIPDPFQRPDHVYPPPLMIKTTNVKMYGMSRLKIVNLTSDLVAMKINFGLHMPQLIDTGNYELFPLAGIFTLNITNALWQCGGELKITESGNLAVSKIELDLRHRDNMKIHIEKGGLIGSFLNSFGDVILETMKSYILQVVTANIENYLNQRLKNLQIRLPNSVPPIDIFAFEVRKVIRNSVFDPYHIPNYEYVGNFLVIETKHCIVHGAASLHRTGNVKIFYLNSTIQAMASFGVGRMHGSCDWEIGVFDMYTKYGCISFHLDYVNVSVIVNQSLDLTKKPTINDINVKLGNIQLVTSGSGMLEYVLEFATNVIVNWLRNTIVKLFDTWFITQADYFLSDIDFEEIISKQLSFDGPNQAGTFQFNDVLKFGHH